MNHLVTVHRASPAMGTLFEVALVGNDEEHLAAVAEAALDEVQRVERLLSRFDPRSEISRINRLAHRTPVLVDRELAALLGQCDWGWRETGGAFDITAGSGPGITWENVAWNPDERTIQFGDERIRLDLGGVGKGYALDRAWAVIASHGVDRALLHGGVSSVLGRGLDAAGEQWPVLIADPAVASEAPAFQSVKLCDAALSVSAVRRAGEDSDIVDPRTGQRLESQEQVAVLGDCGVDAEIWSTAILVRPDLASHALCLGSHRLCES